MIVHTSRGSGSNTAVNFIARAQPQSIPSRREPERLFSLAKVAVVDRPGQPLPDPTPPFPTARGVVRVEGPSLPISATSIRERVRRGESVRYLVPVPVAEFITRRGLYA